MLLSPQYTLEELFMRLSRIVLIILLLIVPLSAVATTEIVGVVKGKVVSNEVVQYRGVVALWSSCQAGTEDLDLSLGRPPFSAELSEDGSFTLEAPAGEYCLGVVVKRTPSENMGPPAENDLMFMTPRQNGELFKVKIERGKTLDVGIQTESWPFIER
jgi:hypothetical protein